MLRKLMVSTMAGVAIAVSATSFAQAQGTAAEAKAMLLKAAAAMKADKAKTITWEITTRIGQRVKRVFI